MNIKTAELFKKLMKNGSIDRKIDTLEWSYYEETEVLEEMQDLASVFDFDIFRTNGRIYLVPLQNNDFFLKNNMDFKKDIKSTESRKKDLYLMNYLAIYILYLFFNGEGTNPQSRNFITKEEIIRQFTKYCETVEKTIFDEDNFISEYSENFKLLSQNWLQKIEGDSKSIKALSEKYGVLNKVITKFKVEELFVENNETIKPTKKLTDLMPYFLNKQRIENIQQWINRSEENGTNTQN